MARSMPAFSIMYQSRPQVKPVPAVGDLTPVRPGGMGYHWMRCSVGHDGLYQATVLRQAAKNARYIPRCRECVAIEKGERR